jgi:hypothetical protein
MSYVTVEVEISDGRIVAREPNKLPLKGKGFLTILNASLPVSGTHPTARKEPRPSGLAKGEFTVAQGFNEPLPEETLRDFEGR